MKTIQFFIAGIMLLASNMLFAAVPSSVQNLQVGADEPSNFVLIHADVSFLVPINAKDNDGTLTTSWDSVSGATSYQYRICQDGVCGDWIEVSTNSAQIDFALSGNYTVEVRACNSDGCGSSSTTDVVEVIGTQSAAQPEAAPAPHVEPIPSVNTAELVASDAVGAIAGEFRVNESGQATYNIPIFTPTGRAGVAPQVALSYSSQGGKGILGLGWSLSAGSAISRCRQTEELDGQDLPVTLTLDDRFCLDGQRLILDSGTYGVTGSVYRTELASQTRVTAFGSEGNGPQYFKVERKDGSVSYYGNSVDSRLKANAVTSISGSTPNTIVLPTILTWAQNEFIDNENLVNSNKISYHYDKNETYGEQYLSHIDYAPNNSIEFVYENRPYYQTAMGVGGVSRITKYLSEVIAKDNGVALRRYELSYLTKTQPIIIPRDDNGQPIIIDPEDVNPGTVNTVTSIAYPLRIDSITESARNAAGTWVSLEPTKFTWQGSTKGYIAAGQTTFSNEVFQSNYQITDINGDNKADFIYATKRYDDIRFRVLTSTDTGFGGYSSCVVDIGKQQNDKFNWSIIDFNGDGKGDLYTTDYNWSTYKYDLKVFLNAGSCIDGTSAISGVSSTDYESAKPLDYNADGLPDILYKDGNTRKIRFMEKTDVSSAPYQWGPAYPVKISIPSFDDEVLPENFEVTYYKKDFQNMQAADFNADGKVDPVVKATRRIETIECEDGEDSDMPCEERETIKHVSLVAKGLDAQGYFVFEEFGTVPNWGIEKDANGNRVRQFVDINGDGLVDFLYKDINNKYWYYRLGTGKGFLAAVQISVLGTEQSPAFTDYDKDGRLDIAYRSGDYLRILVGSDFGFQGNQISTSIPVHEHHQLNFADVNGDGKPEFIEVNLVGTNSLGVNSTLNKFVHENVIHTIDNGMGNKTSISYKAFTDPNQSQLYTKGHNAYSHYWGANDTCSASTQTSRNACSPVFDISGPMYVVAKVESSSPTKASPNDKVAVSYRYGEAKMQSKGRGFLGFEWLETKDEQTNIVTKTEYRQDYPFIGSPKLTTTSYNGLMLSQAYNVWSEKIITLSNNNKIRFPYILKSSEASWDLKSIGGRVFTSQTYTQNAYDDYANVTNMKVVTGNLYTDPVSTFPDITNMMGVTSKTTVNTYSDNVTKWHLGRLATSQVTHTRTGKPDIVRNSAFEYDSINTGFLIKEIIEPSGGNTQKLVTIHQYDNYGNKTLKRTCSTHIATSCGSSTIVDDTDAYHINRWSETVYETSGRYPKLTKNAFGQVTSEVLTRNALGQPTSVRSLSGDVADTLYGAFGGKYFSRSKTGAWSKTIKAKCNGTSDCPSPAVYFTKTWAAGGALGFTYFDALGREVQKASRSFGGQFSVTSTEYNQRGLAIRTTEPVLQDDAHELPDSTNTTYATTSEYDTLGRPWKVTNPDGGITTITFNGLTTTSNNPKGQTKTEVKDASGKTVSVTDNLGGVLTYSYDATGNLLELKLNGITQSTMTYDSLGRKISMWDADKGGANNKLWTYSYNALGEMVEQIDAKGQKIQTWNDRLGRPVERLNLTSGGATESRQTWTYDNDVFDENGDYKFGYSTGQLTLEQDLTSGYKVEPDYDHLGRAYYSETTIEGVVYLATTVFDQYGRVFQSFDAASSEFANAGVRNVYNQFGFLKQVRDARNNVNGKVYKTILAMDARGNVTRELSGNGVETVRTYFDKTGRLKTIISSKGNTKVQHLEYYWDNLGNLEWRKKFDSSTGQMLPETFSYDGLNRLLNAQHSNETMALTYDAGGNITSKTGVGSYSYGETKCGVIAGPHAVTSTSTGNKSYCYDYNGNMVSDTERQMQYSTFDKLTQVTKGGHTTQFNYAPSRSRYKRVDIKGSKTTTTYYVGNVEVIKHSTDTFTTYRRNLGGLIIDEKTNGLKTTSYLHTDHLGSTDVITDSTGAIEQEFSFNAFGARRDPNDWKTYNANAWSIALSPFDSTARTSRGFTGHEQMDETGLIHMNGRVYDPTLGRFIQADPHIQAPSDSQSLNRYSYVKNNPLSYTDPTGYFFKKLHKALMKISGAWALHKFLARHAPWAVGIITTALNFIPVVGQIVSAAFAADHNFYLTGSFTSAIKSFATSYVAANAFGAVGEAFDPGTWQNVLGNALVGGVMSELQGGKFGHGFVSAGFSAAFKPMVNKIGNGAASHTAHRVIVAGLIGGTASRLSGGKFANGAVTGAMSQALNGEKSLISKRSEKAMHGVKPKKALTDAYSDEYWEEFFKNFPMEAAMYKGWTDNIDIGMLPRSMYGELRVASEYNFSKWASTEAFEITKDILVDLGTPGVTDMIPGGAGRLLDGYALGSGLGSSADIAELMKIQTHGSLNVGPAAWKRHGIFVGGFPKELRMPVMPVYAFEKLYNPNDYNRK